MAARLSYTLVMTSPYCRCIPLWPGAAPNETDVPKTPPETRTPDDGEGCGPGRDAPCDHIRDVSMPNLTPFLVSNGTGAAIIIAPGGGYHDLAFGKEGIDVAHMCTDLDPCASLRSSWHASPLF